MNKIGLQKNISTAVALLSMIVFFSFLWFFWVSASKIYTDLIVINSNSNPSGAKLQSMRKELRYVSKDIVLLKSLTVEEGQIPALLNTIERMGNKGVGVSVQSVDLIKGDELVEISISLAGNLKDVREAMDDIISMKYAISPNSIDIRPQESFDEPSNNWNVNLSIRLPLIKN